MQKRYQPRIKGTKLKESLQNYIVSYLFRFAKKLETYICSFFFFFSFAKRSTVNSPKQRTILQCFVFRETNKNRKLSTLVGASSDWMRTDLSLVRGGGPLIPNTPGGEGKGKLQIYINVKRKCTTCLGNTKSVQLMVKKCAT